MQGERFIGGVWCHEVLADLSAYVDGDLDDARVATLRAHVGGCDRCEHFGAAFAVVVRRLRALAPAEPLPEEHRLRLHGALAALIEG